MGRSRPFYFIFVTSKLMVDKPKNLKSVRPDGVGQKVEGSNLVLAKICSLEISVKVNLRAFMSKLIVYYKFEM